MSEVIMTSECTVGGHMWSYRWTTLLSSVGQTFYYNVIKDVINWKYCPQEISSVTFLITVSDWIQSKIQPHEYVYHRITVSDWIQNIIQPHEYVYHRITSVITLLEFNQSLP